MRLDWVMIGALAGCVAGPQPGESLSGDGGTGSPPDAELPESTTTGSETTTGNGSSGTAPATGSEGSDDGDPPLLDVGSGDPADLCGVDDGELDALGECDEVAPPDSFEPDVQWTWNGGENNERFVTVTPLVANMTDDNADDMIDLCDTPDIVSVVSAGIWAHEPADRGYIYVLDGATGSPHARFGDPVVFHVTPAIGDIDGDGYVEVVAGNYNDGRLIAFEHDGTLKWLSDEAWDDGDGIWPDYYFGSIALADLDADGVPEILAGTRVFGADGDQLWAAPTVAGDWSATTAADLDEDGSLEVVIGHAAYEADGTEFYLNADVSPGFPHVADFDGDGRAEVLLTTADGLSMLEHDGSTTYMNLRPTDVPAGGLNWLRPAAVHNYDADIAPEFSMSSQIHYTAYNADASIVWDAMVADMSGLAGGTAFDFLGDGGAEAMYADEDSLFVFDESGSPLLTTPRHSLTGTEYPVVADVDNDGSAEIVVGSHANDETPTLQVIRDVEDRWIQGRRIWNQHTYHVTNIREDGTLPRPEPMSWKTLNTFRTQAQILTDGGGVCVPAG